MVEANGDFLKSILSLLLEDIFINFSNTPDKLRCQYYFYFCSI